MSKVLWTIYVNGQYAGRTWQPVTTSEAELIAWLLAEGYDSSVSAELGDLKAVECQK